MENERTLFPDQQVKLLSGEYVTIRPWGLVQGRLLRPRILTLVERLGSLEDSSFANLIAEFEDEIIEVIRETCEWSPEEMEAKVKYEDVYVLAQAVISVCLIRADGGGVVGKMIALAQPLVGMLQAAGVARAKSRDSKNETKPSPEPSSSSSPTATA